MFRRDSWIFGGCGLDLVFEGGLENVGGSLLAVRDWESGRRFGRDQEPFIGFCAFFIFFGGG